jgi:hypothetical protein
LSVVALISSYKEGTLLDSCVRSVRRHVDDVIVFEGPTDGIAHGSTPLRLSTLTSVRYGNWKSDAEKRTAMLLFALKATRLVKPLWVLWLDGDEVLLHGEYLRDWINRADKVSGAGGFPLRLVELDGSVALCHGKLVRGDLVKRYVESSYQLELLNGVTIAVPNEPICAAGGIPLNRPEGLKGADIFDDPDLLAWLGRNRPPLIGEPHLLHRSLLRDPDRDVPRLHEAEKAFYQ